jgi:hypothetical protein
MQMLYNKDMKYRLSLFCTAAIISIIFGTIYVVVQQSQRRDANYPQIQMSEDTATLLNSGLAPSALTPGSVDIRNSLKPFTVIYDKSGKPVAGNGYLDNKLPAIPIGVLTASNNKDYSYVSWQPDTNVRVASVTVASNKYYVVSGRSLREIEKNEDATFQLTFVGWALALIVLGVRERVRYA